LGHIFLYNAWWWGGGKVVAECFLMQSVPSFFFARRLQAEYENPDSLNVDDDEFPDERKQLPELFF